MIIIAVEIPVMEVSYDFQIDEDVPFGIVRNEIADMICRSNKCIINGNVKDIIFFEKRRRIILDMSRTAYENGLQTGSELVMA